jgi:hypothetical protein
MPLYAERHLVLVNRPGWQAMEDFEEIKARIEAKAPDIEVFIVTTDARHTVQRKKAARRPSLIVSPSPLGEFQPERGHILRGRTIAKDIQLNRLKELGIPVPMSEVLTPETRLDPAMWGPVLLLKPLGYQWTSKGLGMSLVPTGKLRYRPPEDYPPDHPGRHTPFLVQNFIDTGPHAGSYRVNTLLGEPLYCMYIELAEPRIDLKELREESASEAIATNSSTVGTRRRWMADDADVLDLARRCHAAFPGVPLKGIDILRDVNTGKLFVLELNTSSDTWHISSNFYEQFRSGDITQQKMIGQFGAWDVAAGVLIEHTRRYAI